MAFILLFGSDASSNTMRLTYFKVGYPFSRIEGRHTALSG
jgi:hypothetical protein